MGELSNRRSQTANRIDTLRSKLYEQAANFVTGKACVYATGSFGRCEASLHSDLDLFILGKTEDEKGKDGKKQRLLRPLAEICLKAELIDVANSCEIPEFSQDGKYLTHYSVDDLTRTLGTPDDDVTNTFTARLLLLLESKPLLEDAVYKDVIDDVIAAYWKDYEDHKTDFMPAFVANDILRLWRTFCVNYEARTKNISNPEKVNVYKTNSTVSPRDMVDMVALTPTERLEELRGQVSLRHAQDTISRLLHQYESFLETTNADEQELQGRFADKKTATDYMNKASSFGDMAFDALKAIGDGNHFYRLLVV